VRGNHTRLGEGERKVRLGQDSLPNKAEMSGDYIRCFTLTPKILDLGHVGHYQRLLKWSTCYMRQIGLHANTGLGKSSVGSCRRLIERST
jgi:hypothetical protein